MQKKMIHLQKRRQSRKTQKSGSTVKRVCRKIEEGRKKVKKKCLFCTVKYLLGRRNRAETRKTPKFPHDPTGLFVDGKQHIRRIGKI